MCCLPGMHDWLHCPVHRDCKWVGMLAHKQPFLPVPAISGVHMAQAGDCSGFRPITVSEATCVGSSDTRKYPQ